MVINHIKKLILLLPPCSGWYSDREGSLFREMLRIYIQSALFLNGNIIIIIAITTMILVISVMTYYTTEPEVCSCRMRLVSIYTLSIAWLYPLFHELFLDVLKFFVLFCLIRLTCKLWTWLQGSYINFLGSL